MKKLLVTGLALVVSTLTIAGSAMALEVGIDGLWLSDTPWDIIKDNETGDATGVTGKISLVSYQPTIPTGANGWVVDVTAQDLHTLNPIGFPNPEFDLLSLAVSSADEGELWVMLSEVNLDLPNWTLNVGGTTDGTVEFFALLSDANGYWDMPLSALTSFYSTTMGNFSNNFDFNDVFGANAATMNNPYSMIIGAHVIHNGVGNTSFDLTAVPEPSLALIFGTGLMGLVGIGRRKLKKD